MPQTTSRDELAGNVRAAMARRRVTIGEIAAAIGKSQTAASERVNGRTHFRVDELQTIANLLGIPVSALIEPAPQHAEAASA